MCSVLIKLYGKKLKIERLLVEQYFKEEIIVR